MPEIYFKIFSYRNLRKIWKESSESEIISYLEAFKQRRALKSALNWYRANFKNDKSVIGDIFIPTLIIYGINDMAIDVISVDNSEKFLKGRYRIEMIEDREVVGDCDGGTLLQTLLGNKEVIELDKFDQIDKFNYDPYKKTRTYGMQRITSEEGQ